jgi:hypothetical protein
VWFPDVAFIILSSQRGHQRGKNCSRRCKRTTKPLDDKHEPHPVLKKTLGDQRHSAIAVADESSTPVAAVAANRDPTKPVLRANGFFNRFSRSL